MPSSRNESLSSAAPRCADCGEPIGVYEPLVRMADGYASTTSRAAEPGLSAGPGEAYYHVACFGSVIPAAGWTRP